MNHQLQNNHHLFQLRLDNIAWPIKCYWAKHFPIQITTDIDFAAIDFKQIYIHETLTQFQDDVLFCVLAHEWAHRMVSPKSIDISRRITQAVAAALDIDFELAQLVSDPAIELIVDRSNCEIKLWENRYKTGFSEVFTCFVDELEEKTTSSENIDFDRLQLQQMMLALRMLNVSPMQLPAFICHLEADARFLIHLLFEDWYEAYDEQNHIKKIIRFSKAFYEMLPYQLLKQRSALRQLLSQLTDLIAGLATLAKPSSHQDNTNSNSLSASKHIKHQHDIFDTRLTRLVSNHLLLQSRKARQTTGLWQPSHPFAKLDIKRSFRCYPTLVPGMTTRLKTDSIHMSLSGSGKLLRFCLLVDDSGSMSGDEAKFSRSICEGINQFSALHHFHIGLITFGQEIDVSLPPEQHYQKLRAALSELDGHLGGTNLFPPLKRLSQFLESDRNISHAMLITDASFNDWHDCQQELSNILSQIKMTVLVINTDIPVDVLKGLKKNQKNISFFSVNPTEELDTAMLKEMI